MAAFIIFAQIFFMYQQKLPIILASKSPRRQELMTAMNLDFKVVLKEVDETYPEELLPAEIAVYIAEKKARAFDEDSKGSIIITADTIVAYNGEILGKPEDAHHATEMLTKLSGTNHQVYTGVSLTFMARCVRSMILQKYFSMNSRLHKSNIILKITSLWIRPDLMAFKTGSV